jgi:hypothetical protein
VAHRPDPDERDEIELLRVAVDLLDDLVEVTRRLEAEFNTFLTEWQETNPPPELHIGAVPGVPRLNE